MKNLKIILALIVVVLSVGVATRLGEDGDAVVADEKRQTTVYFVPIVDYFSTQSDIDGPELKEKQVVYLADDGEALKDYVDDEDIRVNTISALVDKVKKEKRLALLRWDQVTPGVKTLPFNGKYLWDKDDAAEYAFRTEQELSPEESKVQTFQPARLTKINFLGDIMLSRHVNTQMERNGFDYPWLKVKDTISDADITFANLEVPISDLRQAPAEGMSFIAPTKNLKYLKDAGIDIVSVANNHTANFGEKAFTENLANLKKAGIKVCGGGLSEAEARNVTKISVNQTNFGFLCQSAITGSLYAEGGSAGVPYLGIEPWYRDDKNSLAQLEADIKKAKEKEGVLITSPHWGVEYKHAPNASQQKVAKLMVDSGADLVIGTHPHVVQSSEYYNGNYISYSLGNFIFDQEWSEATKQGVIASAYFYGNKNLAVNLIPLQIENYAQPKFVTGNIAEKILGDIEENSKGF